MDDWKRPNAPRPKLGGGVDLYLAAGGPLGGAWEIGALNALQDGLSIGFPSFRLIAGVSIGAVVGAGLAAGVSPAHLHQELILDRRSGLRTVLRRGAKGLVRDVVRSLWRDRPFGRGARSLLAHVPATLLDGDFFEEQIRSYLIRWCGADDFRSLQSPFVAFATCMEDGAGTPFGTCDHPDVSPSRAIRASAAAPGLFGPVNIGGRTFCDGALAQTGYAQHVARDPPDILIFINPVTACGRGPVTCANLGMAEMIDRSVRNVLHIRAKAELLAAEAALTQTRILTIEPSESTTLDCGLFDLDHCGAAYSQGYESALAIVQRLRAAISGLWQPA